MKFIIIYPLLLTFIITNLFSHDLRFRHLGVEDGLSQNTINCLYQDRYGIIWIGTEDGLNLYDGYQFKVFTHNPLDSMSLSHSWIWDIKEDKNGNLWIATWQGINRYDRRNNRFIRYLCKRENGNAINGERPSSICLDSSGTLWVGTWGNGIKYYQPQKDRFICPENIQLPSNFIRRLYTDHTGTLWIGTWNGLVSMNPSDKNNPKITVYQKQSRTKNSIGSNRILSIFEDKDKKLWVGTFGGGLNLFSPQNKKFKHYKYDPQDPFSISNDQISFIFEDNKGLLWIGTISGGLNCLNKKTEKFRHYRNQTDNSATLISDKLYCILQDRSGMLWIGGEGLNLLSNKLNRFTIFRHNPHNTNSLSYNKVWDFCEDEHENLWIGTDGGGLNFYNRHTNHFIVYKNNPLNRNSLSCNDISALVYDDHKIWIGTNGGGLNIFNIKNKSFTRIQDDPLIPQIKGINNIIKLAFDDSKKLWIGTYENGLIVYDYKQQIFKKYNGNPNDKNSLTGNYISALFCDSKGTMWIGGGGGGLCRYNKKQNNFTRFLHETDNPKSLISNIVHTIYETVNSGERILWVGTSSGLSYMNLSDSTNEFHHVNINNVLNNNVIYAILDDNEGNLWLSGNQGIYRLNPQKMTAKHFTYHDGLQSNEFNAGASLKCKNGLFLFGGVNGFNSFFPKDIRVSHYMPPVILTSFKIMDKPWQGNKPLINISSLKLKYKQNFFSFEFSALDFNEPQTNRYKYKMEGFDANWIECGTRNYGSYTNLDAGSYTLRITGSNSDGVWSAHEIAIPITITPPYWATWWFRLLAILAIFVLFYLFHKIRVARLLEIERLRVQIASDLHDDIGSALTKIAINSEIIQNTKNSGKIRAAARSIGQVSRAIITTMSDIIWSIDARNDTIGNLLDRMKDVAVDMFSDHDIQYNFKHSGLNSERKIAIQLRQNLFLIFKEAINNIVRHSQADDVSIELTNSDGRFIMKISDNGRGFDLQNSTAGNGIKNMKMRAQRIGAQIEIINNNGITTILSIKSF
jgi:ligand-binding sensor domain-containing protein/two-component sensor histidine kinase